MTIWSVTLCTEVQYRDRNAAIGQRMLSIHTVICPSFQCFTVMRNLRDIIDDVTRDVLLDDIGNVITNNVFVTIIVFTA